MNHHNLNKAWQRRQERKALIGFALDLFAVVMLVGLLAVVCWLY